MQSSIDGFFILLFILAIFGVPLWLACSTAVQIIDVCIHGFAYLFHGNRPDSNTRIHLKALVAGMPFSDRHGDVWVRECDIPPRSSALPIARTIGYVPGAMPRTPLHDLTLATLTAERDEDDYTIIWDGPGRSLTLVFMNETVTAIVSPSHPDYPATKIRVADLLARTIWPVALQDDEIATRTESSTDIVDRLRGRYAIGPHLPNGEPEFGWRQFQATTINNEAADVILGQRIQIARLENAFRQVQMELTDARDEIDASGSSERF